MDSGTIAALITSTAALISAVFASIFGVIKWRDERNARLEAAENQRVEWEKTFEDARKGGVAEWRVQFLRELVSQRVATYPDVLKTLGAVRDVVGERDEHLRSLVENRADLLKTADELLGHLYGPAGLVMSMTTRNYVHGARAACMRFQSVDVTPDSLISPFFYARRHLREEIQIADSTSVETALNELGKERLATPGSE